jgi:alkylated DNA repair protein alkB family protein 4
VDSVTAAAAAAAATISPSFALPSYTEPIPGLFVFEDFITAEEESSLIKFLDCDDIVKWKESTFNGKSFGKRWGVHCNLRDRKVGEPENLLPTVIQNLIQTKILPALQKCSSGQQHQSKSLSRLLHDYNPNEANAIDYIRRKGHWLKSHVDDRQLSKEPIVNLSLVGDCVMTFKNEKLASPPVKLKLRRRTLQVLTGKARYDYSHGIQHTDLLSDRRVSITIRESPVTTTTAATTGATTIKATSTNKLPHYAWRRR